MLSKQTRGRPLAIALLVGALALIQANSTSASLIVIDDFDSPSPGNLLILGGPPGEDRDNPLYSQEIVPGVLGLEREVLLAVQGMTAPNSALAVLGSFGELTEGSLQLATAGVSGSSVTLLYDGVDDSHEGDSLGIVADLLAMGDTGGVMLRFVSSQSPRPGGLDVAIKLAAENGNFAQYVGKIANASIAIDRFIPFSSFQSSGETPRDIKSIQFVFNGPSVPNVDFQLDMLAVVPEPDGWFLMTAAGLMVGGGALRLRKGRSRRWATR